MAFVRGDHDVNEVKVINAIGAIDLHMAEEAAIREVGGMPGFMSPIGIKKGTKIVVDTTVMNMYNAVSGANEVGMHYTGVNPARDFDKNEIIVTDIRLIKDGDPCPRCGGTVHMTRGIEAGQVFTLGTKYSKALHATYLDEQGKEQLLMMGCYGIGVSRTMAAAIEQCNDKDGIIWPRSIAPYEVVVVPVNAKVPEQLALAEEIYEELKKAGVDTIIDDRKERAGVKFKDCDLIGYPLRITVGPKAVENDTIELKVRKNGETAEAGKAEVVAKAIEMLKNL